jgi:hypothetical protein
MPRKASMQSATKSKELSPLYRFNLTTFHIDENESRHLVGDFKLEFARNLDVNPFGHFAPR